MIIKFILSVCHSPAAGIRRWLLVCVAAVQTMGCVSRQACLSDDDCASTEWCVAGTCVSRQTKWAESTDVDTSTEGPGDDTADFPLEETEHDASVDAGTVDAGTVDAGTVDAGTVDAGTVDAGTVDAGTDTDTGSDPGFSILITNIDGDGALAPISETPANINDPFPAEHRFRNVWIISGERLDTVTGYELRQTDGGDAVFTETDGLRFERGGTSMKRRLLLPAGLVAGAFTLTLTNSAGDAVAQTYILQGEKGEKGEKGEPGEPGEPGKDGEKGDGFDCDGTNCTILHNQNIIVNGEIKGNTATISGDLRAVNGIFTGDLAVAGNAEIDILTVRTSYWLPECPEGYERDSSDTDRILCSNEGEDEMVKVGNFWIDRYEVSLWSDENCTGTQYGTNDDDYPGTYPDNGNWTMPVYSCSVPNVTPSRYLTWFQAQQACELSGKELCTNAQWQAAAADTHDPGSSDGSGGSCKTESGGSRNTGMSGPHSNNGCTSVWGAEDMIGNLWEWTTDWWGHGSEFGDDTQESVFGGDGAWSVDPAQSQGIYSNYFPAAGLRGGDWNDASRAGVFALFLNAGPTHSDANIGARCCRHK